MDDNDIIKQFFEQAHEYGSLSTAAKEEWASLLKLKIYARGAYFIRVGQIPRNVAFVVSGLFSQYYISQDGTSVIKNFFHEGRLAGAIPATLTQKDSPFAIDALEETVVREFNFLEFKKLVRKHPDIADTYIHYMEKYWVIEKEPEEISFRNDTSATRYHNFLIKYPQLVKRLKKHQIASYLGVTPTQLSRILNADK